MEQKSIKPLITEAELQKRIAAVAEQLETDYRGKELVVVGVLKGSFIFMADLVRHINLPLCCDFVRVASYEKNKSTGVVRMEFDMTQPVEGKHVLLIEDIVDTGNTLRYLVKHMKSHKPASLKVCTLLYKEVQGYDKKEIDYIGFTVPNKYVVGYGLDDEGLYRSLRFVGFIE